MLEKIDFFYIYSFEPIYSKLFFFFFVYFYRCPVRYKYSSCYIFEVSNQFLVVSRKSKNPAPGAIWLINDQFSLYLCVCFGCCSFYFSLNIYFRFFYEQLKFIVRQSFLMFALLVVVGCFFSIYSLQRFFRPSKFLHRVGKKTGILTERTKNKIYKFVWLWSTKHLWFEKNRNKIDIVRRRTLIGHQSNYVICFLLLLLLSRFISTENHKPDHNQWNLPPFFIVRFLHGWFRGNNFQLSPEKIRFHRKYFDVVCFFSVTNFRIG